MKKLLIMAMLAVAGTAHAVTQPPLTTMYVGKAQNEAGHSVILPMLFIDEKQCMGVGGDIAKVLMATEGRGFSYTCEPVVIDTKTLKDFAKAQK